MTAGVSRSTVQRTYDTASSLSGYVAVGVRPVFATRDGDLICARIATVHSIRCCTREGHTGCLPEHSNRFFQMPRPDAGKPAGQTVVAVLLRSSCLTAAISVVLRWRRSRSPVTPVSICCHYACMSRRRRAARHQHSVGLRAHQAQPWRPRPQRASPASRCGNGVSCR